MKKSGLSKGGGLKRKSNLKRKKALSKSGFKRGTQTPKMKKPNRKRLQSRSNKRKSISPFWKEVKKLDIAFSQYVRLSNADGNGFVCCYTCGYRAFWKRNRRGGKSKIQNGHFIPRTKMVTRWDPINNHPQCVKCNEQLDGNLEVYEKALRAEYGDDAINDLIKRGSKPVTLDLDYLRELRKLYEKKVRELRREKGL